MNTTLLALNKEKKSPPVDGILSTYTPEQLATFQEEFEIAQLAAKKKAEAKAKSDKEQKNKKEGLSFKQKKNAKIKEENELVQSRGPFVKTKTELNTPTFDVTPEWELDENNEIVWITKPTKIIYTGPEKMYSKDHMQYPVEIMKFSLMGAPLRSDDAKGIGKVGI